MSENRTPKDEDIQIRALYSIYNFSLGKPQMVKHLNTLGVKSVIEKTKKVYKSSQQVSNNAASTLLLIKKGGKVTNRK